MKIGKEKLFRQNIEKAAKVYDVIDSSGGYYKGTAVKECRSDMNITWRMANEELEKKFIKEAESCGLKGLKGHRSVGGLRASIYNAFPLDGINALVSFMKDFQKRNG